jgi:hypothetical protein
VTIAPAKWTDETDTEYRVRVAERQARTLWVVYVDETGGRETAWTSESPEPPQTTASASQRWLRMVEVARQRRAAAPDYPDTPEDVAEQEAVTSALAEGQARAQSET